MNLILCFSTLFSKYDELTLCLGRRPTASSSFHNLIVSIRDACTFLTNEHFKVATNCYSVDKELFSLTFIDTLLIPQLNIRQCDPILIDSLKFASSNKDSASFKILAKAFTTPRATRPINLTNYNGFSYLNLARPEGSSLLSWVPFYATAHEIFIFYEIILKMKNTNMPSQIEKARNELSKEGLLFKIFEIRLFTTSFSTTNAIVKKRYENGFLFKIQKQFQISPNHEFETFFSKLIENTRKDKIDPIEYFINIFSNDIIPIKVIHSEEFQRYALMRLSNEYIERLRRYEVLLSILDCKNSICGMCTSSNSDLLEILPFATSNIEISDLDDDIIKRMIKFWYLLSDCRPIPPDPIYEELSTRLISESNTEFLREHEIKRMRQWMKSILHSNKRKIITIVPRFVEALQNRFRYISTKCDFDTAIFQSLLSIIHDSKLLFVKHFCYYFKFVDDGIDQIEGKSTFPYPSIRSGWMRILGLIGKFVFSHDNSLHNDFSTFLCDKD